MSNISSDELQMKVDELRDLNKELNQKNIDIDELLQLVTNKKESLVKELENNDKELERLDNEIQKYTKDNEMNSMKGPSMKRKKIQTNLNILSKLLDQKSNEIDKKKIQLEDEEKKINKRISNLTPSQRKAFEEIMESYNTPSEINKSSNKNGKEINTEYDKMNEIYFQEIFDELGLGTKDFKNNSRNENKSPNKSYKVYLEKPENKKENEVKKENPKPLENIQNKEERAIKNKKPEVKEEEPKQYKKEIIVENNSKDNSPLNTQKENKKLRKNNSAKEIDKKEDPKVEEEKLIDNKLNDSNQMNYPERKNKNEIEENIPGQKHKTGKDLGFIIIPEQNVKKNETQGNKNGHKTRKSSSVKKFQSKFFSQAE